MLDFGEEVVLLVIVHVELEAVRVEIAHEDRIKAVVGLLVVHIEVLILDRLGHFLFIFLFDH